MQFTDQQIELARSLKLAGVPWVPSAGHYVLDQDEIVLRESPFQDRVYFILNLPHFVKLCGSEDRLKEIMLWLPTWDQARGLLRESGLSDQALQSELLRQNAIADGRELIALYELILLRIAEVGR